MLNIIVTDDDDTKTDLEEKRSRPLQLNYKSHVAKLWSAEDNWRRAVKLRLAILAILGGSCLFLFLCF